MDGIATLEPDALVSAGENTLTADSHQAFASNLQASLRDYFTQLDGEEPSMLYNLVLKETEIPLLKTVMRFTNNNQSKAANILGISRGTLRKKLAFYDIN